jgi:2-haloacid dehalogenase
MTKPIRLADFDAVTFDVYGTLIDWEPTLTEFLVRIARANGIDKPGPDLMAVYDKIRARIQIENPALLYPEILRRCYDAFCRELKIAPTDADRAAFGRGPETWPAYPDSSVSLKALQRRAKIGALSNIDEASLKGSCRKLDIAFDLVVTAERVKNYKPALPHFTTALAELQAMGVPKERVLHVAQSLRADVAPANALGLTCVWVNRKDRQLGLTGAGTAEAKPDLTVASLEELLEKIA